MDALFDLLGSIFPVIIIVVVAGARIYALVRKVNQGRKPAQDRSSPETQFPAPLAKNFQSWEDEFRDSDSAAYNAVPRAVTLEQEEALAAKLAAALKDDEEKEEEFSAWNLSVDDDPPPIPTPAQKPTSDLRPDSAIPSAPLSRRSLFQSIPGPVLPEETRLPATEAIRSMEPGVSVTAAIPGSYTEAAVQSPAPAAASGAGFSREAPRRELPAARNLGELIRSLTPLQQGVVWAEILGPPKGL